MKTGGLPCFLCGDLANPGADGTCGLCSGTGRQRGGGDRGRTKMGIDAVMRIRYTISVISEGVIGAMDSEESDCDGSAHWYLKWSPGILGPRLRAGRVCLFAFMAAGSRSG